jgi:hypothetical protein
MYTVMLGNPSDWEKETTLMVEAYEITSLNEAIRIANEAHAKAPAGCLHYTVYRVVLEDDRDNPPAKCLMHTAVYSTDGGHL